MGTVVEEDLQDINKGVLANVLDVVNNLQTKGVHSHPLIL